MAEGLTFGKVVTGAAVVAGITIAAAVGLDNATEWLAEAGNLDLAAEHPDFAAKLNTLDMSSYDKFIEGAKSAGLDMDLVEKIPAEEIKNGVNFTTSTLEPLINDNGLGDTVAKGTGYVNEKAVDLLDGIENKIGDADYARSTFENFNPDGADKGIYDVAKETGAAAWDGAKNLPADISSHKGLVATSALVGGVGTYAATNRNQGKHTAAVNAERGKPSNMKQVASTAGTAARRTAGLGVDLIKTAGNTVGGVANGVNHAVRG